MGITLPRERAVGGRFGRYGGRYVPETLVAALDELAALYDEARADPSFWAEFDALLSDFVGRPSALSEAPRFSAAVGARVLLKREDLNHTGAHKINNTIGQALLARRMGKRRIIAETGAGQHGVATATVCARFGLECVVYMGAEDVARQALNVYRMQLLGATVVPVESGTRTLKDATNEALRDWVTNVPTTHYIIGSVVGPDPYPRMVRDFQSVIGREARAQVLERVGRLPTHGRWRAWAAARTRWASSADSWTTRRWSWSASRRPARGSTPVTTAPRSARGRRACCTGA